MSTEIANGKTLGMKYAVFSRTGTVSGSNTRSETEVNGSISGGGGSSHNGTGYTAPVSGNVTSKTTNYQDIFITEDDGTDHLIQTVDFLVPCHEGHRLTFFFCIPGNADSGSYFEAYNHNSRQTYKHNKALRSTLFPFRASALVVGLVTLVMFAAGASGYDGSFGTGLFSGVFGAVVAGLIMWIVGSIIGGIRASQVRGDSGFRQALGQLGV